MKNSHDEPNFELHETVAYGAEHIAPLLSMVEPDPDTDVKVDGAKEIIAQLQLRIAEMEKSLQEQEELKANMPEIQSVCQDERPRANPVVLIWQSVRSMLGRYCSFLMPQEQNEVA